MVFRLLKKNLDITNELSKEVLESSSKINFTFNNDDLKSNQFEFYIKKLPKDKFDAVIFALAHKDFLKWDNSKWDSLSKNQKSIIFDLKVIVPRS